MWLFLDGVLGLKDVGAGGNTDVECLRTESHWTTSTLPEVYEMVFFLSPRIFMDELLARSSWSQSELANDIRRLLAFAVDF